VQKLLTVWFKKIRVLALTFFYMNIARRVERLNKYYDLLCEKPAEEQVKVVERGRSKDVLRALMSAEAPAELVKRFAVRFDEVLDRDFSDFEMGRINVACGEFEIAKEHFNSGLAEGDTRVLAEIGDLVPSDMPSDKLDYYMRSIEEGVDGADVYAKMGRLFAVQEQTSAAVAALTVARDKSGSLVQKRYHEAEIMWEEGDRTEALELYADLAGKGHYRSIEKLSEIYCEFGQYEQAIEILKHGILCGHNNLLLNLAHVYEECSDHSTAGEYYIAAYEAGINSALIDAVAHLINAEMYEAAFDFCGRAVDEGLPDGHIALMQIYNELGQEELAAQQLRAAIDLGYPVPFEVEYGLLLRENDTDGIIKLCKENVGENPAYYFLLSALYKIQGDREASESMLAVAILENGMLQEFKLIFSLQEQGRAIEANQIFRNLIQSLAFKGLPPDIVEKLGLDESN